MRVVAVVEAIHCGKSSFRGETQRILEVFVFYFANKPR